MKNLSLRKYPSTTALQCFESSARYKSFTKASEELRMTQSAVSKQIAHLEDLIGQKLFIRTPQYLQITQAGTLYLAEVVRILTRIETATLAMLAYDNEVSELTIASHPTLNARWLTPLLFGFGKAHPNIRLDIRDKIDKDIDTDTKDFDMAFLTGDGLWSGMESVKLFDTEFVLVCSPSIYEPINELVDLTSYVFLQLRSRPTLWQSYFSTQGINVTNSFEGPKFDTIYACIAAAESGCGMALVPKRFVKKELDEGKLISPWHVSYTADDGYYMVYATADATLPKVKTLIDWVCKRF